MSKTAILLGIALFVGVILPVLIVRDVREKRRIRKILDSHRNSGSGKASGELHSDPARGWNMNNSPFRRRKSGLRWEGGNVHAANATRGERRRFRK